MPFSQCARFVGRIFVGVKPTETRLLLRSDIQKSFEHILKDEPDYGGFLRGRVVRQGGNQLIVVYCRAETLAAPTRSLRQRLTGLDQLPVPIDNSALVISDNADIYGTVTDLWERTYVNEFTES